MRKFATLVPVALLVVSASTSDAQILGRLQKKAQEAVEKKAEDKLNAKIDQFA